MLRSAKSEARWNVRARPRCTRRWTLSRRHDVEPIRTSPATGRTRPVTTLSSVVFPDPFGPISPTISPGAASNETSLQRRQAAEPHGHVVQLERLLGGRDAHRLTPSRDAGVGPVVAAADGGRGAGGRRP